MVFYFFICVLSKFKSVLLILTSNITLHYISANVDTFIIHAFIFYYHCPVILLKRKKERADSTNGFSPNCYLCFRHNNNC